MIPINQPITLRAETNIDLSEASLVAIRYRRSNGDRGEWEGSASGTKIVYQIGANEVSSPGQCRCQAHVVIGGVDYYGAKVTLTFIRTQL